MKKFVPVLLSIILICGLILNGCSGSPATSPAAASTPPKTSAPPATSAGPATSAPAASSGPPSTQATSPVSGKVYELKLATSFTDRGFQVEGAVQPWINKIQTASNGRIKITLYSGASLVKQVDEYSAVSKGLVDMVNFTPPITPGQFPVTEFVTLPMLFQDGAVAARVNEEILQKYAVNTELKDVKYLWSVTLSPMQLITTKQYGSLADLKGSKIRTEGKLEGSAIEALGGTSVLLPMSELYTSVERGLISGAFLNWQALIVFNLASISKYRVECNFGNRGFPVVMNKNTWNSLPKDIQDIFTNNSLDYGVTTGKVVDGYMEGFKQKVAGMDKAAGYPGIVTLSANERTAWLAAVTPVWDNWAKDMESKGLPGKQILAEAISLRDKYTAAK